MTRCAHCHDRKAKRACPALGADICHLCCGRHRGREIACPPDCSYLQRPALASSSDPNAFGRVMERLIEHSAKHPVLSEQARDAMLGAGRSLEDWQEGLFVGYLLYGHTDERGLRIVDHFQAAQGARLSEGERGALDCLVNSRFSLFEVQEVRRDEGLDLLDLLTGERVTVAERAATHDVVRYDWIGGWIGPRGDEVVLTGAAAQVPPAHRDAVIDAVRSEWRKISRKVAEADRARVSHRLAPVFLRALSQSLATWKPPEIRTPEGDPLSPCEATFQVSDPATARARLAGCKELLRNEDNYVWVDPTKEGRLASGPMPRANFELAGDRLKLFAISRQRYNGARQLVAELLGDLVDLVEETIVAPEDLLRQARAAHTAPEEGAAPHRRGRRAGRLPPEVERAAFAQFMGQHMQRWLDDPLPALGGKTPRQAVRSRAGREQVMSLLKQQENTTRHNPAGAEFDFEPYWQALGLKRV